MAAGIIASLSIPQNLFENMGLDAGSASGWTFLTQLIGG
jgi:hypothetical protein